MSPLDCYFTLERLNLSVYKLTPVIKAEENKGKDFEYKLLNDTSTGQYSIRYRCCDMKLYVVLDVTYCRLYLVLKDALLLNGH